MKCIAAGSNMMRVGGKIKPNFASPSLQYPLSFKQKFQSCADNFKKCFAALRKTSSQAFSWTCSKVSYNLFDPH